MVLFAFSIARQMVYVYPYGLIEVIKNVQGLFSVLKTLYCYISSLAPSSPQLVLNSAFPPQSQSTETGITPKQIVVHPYVSESERGVGAVSCRNATSEDIYSILYDTDLAFLD